MKKLNKNTLVKAAVVLGILLLIIALSVFSKSYQAEKEAENDAIISINEDGENNSVNSKANVFVIGSDTFESNEFAQFTNGTWGDKLPKDARFVLISDKLTISSEDEVLIQKWVSEKKVVMFYGEDVKITDVQEKIGMDIGEVNIGSDADFLYLIYGYGFAETYQQYMPIFLGSNSAEGLQDKITSFLYSKRGF